MTENTCRVNIPDGGRAVTFHTCGRKLSGSEDYPNLCGLHAASERRSLAKEAARISLRDGRAAEVKAADELTRTLSAALGVDVSAQTSMAWSGPEAGISRLTGNAVLKLDDLQKVADRIRELEAALPYKKGGN